MGAYMRQIFAVNVFAAVVPALLFFASSDLMCSNTHISKTGKSKRFLAKDHSHFPVASHKDKLFFFFTTAGKQSVPPGSPSEFAPSYIMTPHHRKIKRPTIDVTNP